MNHRLLPSEIPMESSSDKMTKLELSDRYGIIKALVTEDLLYSLSIAHNPTYSIETKSEKQQNNSDYTQGIIDRFLYKDKK